MIPYDETAPIDVPLLRVFIRLLSAIKADDAAVPALLTDYILRVLCPNTAADDRKDAGRMSARVARDDDIVDL